MSLAGHTRRLKFGTNWILIAFLMFNGKPTTLQIDGFSAARCQVAANLVMAQQELTGSITTN